MDKKEVILETKEVQTTDLDPEQEEKLKGMDIQKMQKMEDRLEKAEQNYEDMMDEVSHIMSHKQKQALHQYVHSIQKSKHEMSNIVKQEIALKEKYQQEKMIERMKIKDLELEYQELRHENDHLQDQIDEVLFDKNTVDDQL